MHSLYHLILLPPGRGSTSAKYQFYCFFIVLIMFSMAGFLLIFGKLVVTGLVESDIINSNLVTTLPDSHQNGSSLFFFSFMLFLSSIILHLPGNLSLNYSQPAQYLQPFMFIITSLGFSAFVNNFGRTTNYLDQSGLLWSFFCGCT